MTQRLAKADAEARESQQQVESERGKLAAILGRLSTGVVALEPDLSIRTANRTAGAILGVDLEQHQGEAMAETCRKPVAPEPVSLGGSTPSGPGRERLAGADRIAARDRPAGADVRLCRVAGGTRRHGWLRRGIRRHHRAVEGAARCRLGRDRASPGPRDQESPHADPVVRRTSAAPLSAFAYQRFGTARSFDVHHHPTGRGHEGYGQRLQRVRAHAGDGHGGNRSQ